MRRPGSFSTTLIISGVLLTVGSTFLLFILPNFLKPATNLWIGDGIFSVDVASTDASRKKGLSGKSELPADEALLMVFPAEDKHGIWMKNMNFPIDVVWLDKNKKIVHIVKNFSPNDSTTRFTVRPAKYVIELAAGTVDNKAIKTNNLAIFKLDNEEED